MKNFIFSVAACATLTACTVPPREFDESHSMAWNVARAGGIYDIQDKELSVEDFNRINRFEYGYNTAYWGLEMASGPFFSMDWSNALLAGVVLSMFEPDKPAAQNSVLSWMPKHMAADEEQARQKLLEIYKQSISRSLKELGFEYSEHTVNGAPNAVYYLFWSDEPEMNCKPLNELPALQKGDFCGVYFAVNRVQAYRTSPIIANLSELNPLDPVWLVTGNSQQSYLYVSSGDKSTPPNDVIINKVSENLPDWNFIYTTGNLKRSGKNANNNSIPMSYLSHKGKPMFFVVEKS